MKTMHIEVVEAAVRSERPIPSSTRGRARFGDEMGRVAGAGEAPSELVQGAGPQTRRIINRLFINSLASK